MKNSKTSCVKMKTYDKLTDLTCSHSQIPETAPEAVGDWTVFQSFMDYIIGWAHIYKENLYFATGWKHVKNSQTGKWENHITYMKFGCTIEFSREWKEFIEHYKRAGIG